MLLSLCSDKPDAFGLADERPPASASLYIVRVGDPFERPWYTLRLRRLGRSPTYGRSPYLTYTS
jgi:hypothetical protein